MSAEAKDRTTKRTKERVNVLIEFGTSQSQSTEMDQTVEALGTSRSQFIRDALAEKLAREGKRSTNGKGNDPRWSLMSNVTPCQHCIESMEAKRRGYLDKIRVHLRMIESLYRDTAEVPLSDLGRTVAEVDLLIGPRGRGIGQPWDREIERVGSGGRGGVSLESSKKPPTQSRWTRPLVGQPEQRERSTFLSAPGVWG
jgi:hypothetical protein